MSRVESGFGVSGFRVQGLGFRVEGLVCRVALGFGGLGLLRFRVWGCMLLCGDC